MAFNHAYYNYSKKTLDQIDHIDEAKSKKPASAHTNLHISAFNFEENEAKSKKSASADTNLHISAFNLEENEAK